MYAGDCVATYDPQDIEQHDDSSDFEETFPIKKHKHGTHSIRIRERSNKKAINRKASQMYIDCDHYPVRLRRNDFTDHPKTQLHFRRSEIRVCKENNTVTEEDIVPVKSKPSLLKHKIIPCLSNIFRRTYHPSKHMSIIEENQVENTPTDNCYNRCGGREHRRIRKLYKSRNYAVQPVFAIEGNAHKTPASFTPTKITKDPLKNHNRIKSKNQYCSPCNMSSTESAESIKERRRKVKRFRKTLKAEIMKEHQKYHQNFKHEQLQYPSVDHPKPSYHVFSTPYQSQTYIGNNRNDQHLNELPSSSSHFWEFLFTKFERKYHTHRAELPRPCRCGGNIERSYSPINGSNQLEPEKCGPSSCIGRNHTRNKQEEQSREKNDCGTSFNKSNSSSISTSENYRTMSIGPQNQAVQSFDPNFSPCQEGHEFIKNSLADKYNGEILCIHNPPCVLINGCLNLQDKKDPQTNLWPVTDMKKSVFHKNKKKSLQEQSCQYHVPYIEVKKYKQVKPEKKIQSVCNHNPPCEIVRGCCKAIYDSQLQNICVHVPMCKKIPECAFGKRLDQPCIHRPKCPDIPICSRNFVVMTTKENIGTQVQPSSCTCEHVPPCTMIPKCLDTRNVPVCPHQPNCGMVPACFMKTKDMVSVSSQYPNSCRIV